MNTKEMIKRYTRQMVLPDVGQDGQQILQESHVLIVGLGGLGSPAALYLAAAGVGKLTLNDFDRVALSNLHRQILYHDTDIGQYKTAAAAAKLRNMNPQLQIETVNSKMDLQQLISCCEQVNAVLDCSDTFATRHLVNRACVASGTPLISGAAIRFEAQVSVFNQNKKSPCYACLYPHTQDEAERCSEAGVIGPLVGIIGSVQAMETLKILLNAGDNLSGRLLLLNAHNMEWRTVTLKKDSQCPVCSNNRYL